MNFKSIFSKRSYTYQKLCSFRRGGRGWGRGGCILHMNLFKILCFSCQEKSRDIVYQRICLLLWLIFTQHGLFEIQLTVYSALSRLTDFGIYDITRCGI